MRPGVPGSPRIRCSGGNRAPADTPRSGGAPPLDDRDVVERERGRPSCRRKHERREDEVGVHGRVDRQRDVVPAPVRTHLDPGGTAGDPCRPGADAQASGVEAVVVQPHRRLGGVAQASTEAELIGGRCVRGQRRVRDRDARDGVNDLSSCDRVPQQHEVAVSPTLLACRGRAEPPVEDSGGRARHVVVERAVAEDVAAGQDVAWRRASTPHVEPAARERQDLSGLQPRASTLLRTGR